MRVRAAGEVGLAGAFRTGLKASEEAGDPAHAVSGRRGIRPAGRSRGAARRTLMSGHEGFRFPCKAEAEGWGEL